MESLLIGVTLVSLGIAVVMSIVAWHLLKRERQRSAARVEALEALAFSEELPASVPSALAMETERPVLQTGRVAANDIDHDDLTSTPAKWDLTLGSHRAADQSALGRPEDMFAQQPAAGVAGRRTLAVGAMALTVVAGVLIASALRTPEIVAAIAVSHDKSAEATTSAQALELLSLRHTTDADGSFIVTGLVQNPVHGPLLGKVDAVVYLFDADGRYFATGRAPLDSPALGPGDEAPFVVRVANVTGIGRFRVGFRQDSGRTIAHVDRRGQLPTGMTGDALGDDAPLATPASAVGRRAGDVTR